MAQAAAAVQAGRALIVEGGTAGAFAAVEVEERHSSAVIEGRGVTVRLKRSVDPAGIAAIAAALAGRR